MDLRDLGPGGFILFVFSGLLYVGHVLTVGWKNSFDDFGKLVLFLAGIGIILMVIGIWESKKEENLPQL